MATQKNSSWNRDILEIIKETVIIDNIRRATTYG